METLKNELQNILNDVMIDYCLSFPSEKIKQEINNVILDRLKLVFNRPEYNKMSLDSFVDVKDTNMSVLVNNSMIITEHIRPTQQFINFDDGIIQ